MSPPFYLAISSIQIVAKYFTEVCNLILLKKMGNKCCECESHRGGRTEGGNQLVIMSQPNEELAACCDPEANDTSENSHANHVAFVRPKGGKSREVLLAKLRARVKSQAPVISIAVPLPQPASDLATKYAVKNCITEVDESSPKKAAEKETEKEKEKGKEKEKPKGMEDGDSSVGQEFSLSGGPASGKTGPKDASAFGKIPGALAAKDSLRNGKESHPTKIVIAEPPVKLEAVSEKEKMMMTIGTGAPREETKKRLFRKHTIDPEYRSESEWNISSKQFVLGLDPQHFRRENKNVVNEKYEIVEKIGKGAFGEVKKVKEKLTGCIRAMKVIPKDKCEASSKFGDEIKILQKLVFLLTLQQLARTIPTFCVSTSSTRTSTTTI